MIQKAWDQRPQTCLSENTSWDVVPAGMQFVEVGLNVFGLCTAVCILVGEGEWKSYDSEDLGWEFSFYLAANTCSQEACPGGQIHQLQAQCSVSVATPRHGNLILAREDRAPNHCTLCCQSPTLLEIFCSSISNHLPFFWGGFQALFHLPFHDHLHSCLPPRHCDRVSQDFLSHYCSLFSAPQSSSVSSNRHLPLALRDK